MFQCQVSVSYLFPFSKYQTKCFIVLLSSYLDIDGIVKFNIYLWSSSKAMADREEKTGGGNDTKIWISWEWR